MYGIAGERRLPELELDWLPGYANSKPVRIGNGASTQFQLDVYGEVMDALYHASGVLSEGADEWNFQLALMDFLEGGWKQPDEGIWEVRGPRRQFTHSKVMAWVAADRAVRSVEELGRDGPAHRWRELRTEIEKWILTNCIDDRGVFVQHPGHEGARRQPAHDPARRLPAARRRASRRHGRGHRSRAHVGRLHLPLPPEPGASTGSRRARARSCCARSGWPRPSP